MAFLAERKPQRQGFSDKSVESGSSVSVTESGRRSVAVGQERDLDGRHAHLKIGFPTRKIGTFSSITENISLK